MYVAMHIYTFTLNTTMNVRKKQHEEHAEE